MKAHDAIAQLPAAHAAPDGHDGAGDFMAENLRRSHEAVLESS